MSKTLLESDEIGSVQRNDFDITTTGQAVITKVIAGTGVTISSTGINPGTGDVTINAAAGGGSGITRSIINISTTTTGAATAAVDYVYLCTGTFTFTLPTAIGNTNTYTVKNVGTGTITITTTSAQTIDAGTAPITISRNNTSLDFIPDGSNWKLT